jgi:hypothetical protein
MTNPIENSPPPHWSAWPSLPQRRLKVDRPTVLFRQGPDLNSVVAGFEPK